jgi:hypothetical protein
MKRIKIAIIAVVAIAAALLGAHLVVNTNWPELLRSIHGR